MIIPSLLQLIVWPLFASEPFDLEAMLKARVETASKYEQAVNEAPSSVTIVTAEEIMRYGDKTLADVLRRQQGFYLTDDRNYEYLGIRGFSRHTDYNNRLLILLNGHRMNENLFDSAYIGTTLGLNLASVERIEIVRGPGSALYGSSAMFGVINIITKKGSRLDGWSGSLEGGSHDQSSIELEYGGSKDRLSWTFAGRYMDRGGEDLYFEEYDFPFFNNGVAEHLDWDRNSSLFFEVKYDEIAFQAYHVKRTKGIPTGAFFTDFNNPDTFTENESFFFDISYTKKISPKSRLSFQASYDQSRFLSHLPQKFLEYEDTFTNRSTGQWLSFEVKWQWDASNGNRLVTGVEYEKHLEAHNRSFDSQVTYFDGDFPYERLSFFVQDEYAFTHNFSMTVGLRFDEQFHDDSKLEDDENPLSPRLALIRHLGVDHSLKLLYGEAFRSPNVYETFYELLGLHEVNQQLKAERINVWELVWEYQLLKGLYGTASIYKYDMDNLIEVGPGLQAEATFVNREVIEAHGFEAGLQYRNANRNLSGYFSLANQHAEEFGVHITNSPHRIVKAGVKVPFGSDFNFSLSGIYESDRNTLYQSKTGSYTLTDARFEANLGNHLNLSLLIKNAFNESYKLPGGYEHLSLPSGIQQNGRQYFLQLRFDY